MKEIGRAKTAATFLTFSVLALISVFAGQTAHAQNQLMEFKSSDAHSAAHFLESLGIDVAGHHADTGHLSVVTTDPEKVSEAIRQFQKQWRVQTKLIDTIPTQPLRELTQSNAENYVDAEAAVEKMAELVRRYPGYAHLINLNELLGLPSTEDGRDLFALQVSANPKVIEDEPKVLYIGQHHARELMTHHIVLDAAEKLLQDHASGDPTASLWLEKSAVWFVPVVNPDGLDHVFAEDRMWRKNRTPNADGSFGVDLNRNYGFKWGECGMHSTEGDSQVFKGPSAGSEIEVRIMDLLNARLRAEYVVSFHSYGDEVLYPYLCGKVAEEKVYYGIRDELADTLGFRVRHASSSGEDFEHHYALYGSISFLLEVGRTFQPSFSHYKTNIWPNISQTLPFVLEKMHQGYVEIQVTDSVTGEPLQAQLNLTDIKFSEGEVRETDLFGTYRWKLATNNYQVQVSAPGYLSQNVSFKSSGRIDTLNIELQKSVFNEGYGLWDMFSDLLK